MQQAYPRLQAVTLLQKMAKTKPGLHRVAAALLEVNPSVATYEFQSDSMIELPEKIHDQFRCELGDIEKEEANGNYACDLATLHLGNSLSHRQPDLLMQSRSEQRKLQRPLRAKAN